VGLVLVGLVEAHKMVGEVAGAVELGVEEEALVGEELEVPLGEVGVRAEQQVWAGELVLVGVKMKVEEERVKVGTGEVGVLLMLKQVVVKTG
jgi:hypothetical protein